jgi:hypothetical protein
MGFFDKKYDEIFEILKEIPYPSILHREEARQPVMKTAQESLRSPFQECTKSETGTK